MYTTCVSHGIRAISDEKSVVVSSFTDSRRTFTFALLRIRWTVSDRPVL